MEIKSKKVIQSILMSDQSKYDTAKQCIESLQSIILSGDKLSQELQHSTKAALVILNKVLEAHNPDSAQTSDIHDLDVFDIDNPPTPSKDTPPKSLLNKISDDMDDDDDSDIIDDDDLDEDDDDRETDEDDDLDEDDEQEIEPTDDMDDDLDDDIDEDEVKSEPVQAGISDEFDAEIDHDITQDSKKEDYLSDDDA